MSKKYIINESIYYFDYETFENYFRKKRLKNHETVEKLEIKLSDHLNTSKDTVHSWRFKNYSPASLEIVKEISNFFDIKDYMILLKRKEQKKQMNDLNQYQINSIKIIYDKVIEHLDYFYHTDGYNNLWFNYVDEGYKTNQIEDELYNFADKKINEVFLSYEKERIFLKNTPIYEEIGEFIYNDLYEIFSGKLSYAYRFEASPDGNTTTQEDYEKALKNFNDIIDKYI